MKLIEKEILKNEYGYRSEELFDGYNRSLALIKNLDRNTYKEIVKIINNFKDTQHDRFAVLLDMLKMRYEYRNNPDVKLLDVQLNNKKAGTPLMMLTGTSIDYIDVKDWQLMEFTKYRYLPFSLGKKMKIYYVYPLMDLKSLEQGIENGVKVLTCFIDDKYSKHDGAEIDYILYKDEENQFNVIQLTANADKEIKGDTKAVNIQF